MDNSEKLTPERYEVLRLVAEISSKNSFKVCPIRDLIEVVTKRRPITPIAVRKMIYELSKSGYIENPLRGCWRLTEKGKKILKEVEGWLK